MNRFIVAGPRREVRERYDVAFKEASMTSLKGGSSVAVQPASDFSMLLRGYTSGLGFRWSFKTENVKPPANKQKVLPNRHPAVMPPASVFAPESGEAA